MNAVNSVITFIYYFKVTVGTFKIKKSWILDEKKASGYIEISKQKF